MSDSKLKVSVWMITYNHQNYISKAIESVLMQITSFDFEIVIGEDCSTDRTRNIVKEFALRNPSKIKAIYQEKNVGANLNAFKYTLPECTGEYVAFLEGDDYWTDPYKLQKQVDFMEKNKEFGLTYTDVNFYYQTLDIFRNNIFKTGYFPIYTFEQFLISGGYIAPCTWLIRNQSIPNNIDMSSTDGSFSLALNIWLNHKVKYLEETTAVYRIANGSASYPDSLFQRYKRENGLFKIKMDFCYKNNIPKSTIDQIHKYHVERIHNLISDTLKSDSPSAKEEWDEFMRQGEFEESQLINALVDEVKNLNKSIEHRLGTIVLKPFFILIKVIRRARRIFSKAD